MTCYRALTNEELVTTLQTDGPNPELICVIVDRFPEMVKIIDTQAKQIEELEDELASLNDEGDD